MCGLIGFSGAGNYNAQNLKILMILNAIDRGADATGFYNPEQGLVKAAEHAKVFLTKTPILNSEIFIGHVRAKTVGVNSDANAHPFAYKHVVLAHNGTLVNHYALLEQYGLNMNDFSVDSQCVAGMLDASMGSCNYDGFEPLDYFKPITQIDGAAALLFKDKRDFINGRNSRLFAYRNEERPLCYGYDENHNMYISSIEGPLEALGLSEITSFESNIVYEIENGEIISETILPRMSRNNTTNTSTAEKVFYELTKGLFEGDFYNLDGTYVEFDLDPEAAKKFSLTKFTKNRLYYVEEVCYSRDKSEIYPPMYIKVRDNSNSIVKAPIFAFNLLYTEFMYSGYVRALSSITTTDPKLGKITIAEIGDVLKVTKEAEVVAKSGETLWVECKLLDFKNHNLPKDKSYNLGTSWVRPLSASEVSTYLESVKPVKEANVKKIHPAKLKKAPAIVNTLFDFATANLSELALEEIELDPELGKMTLDPADYIDQLEGIKESMDDFTFFLLKVLDKRKNQLDHNLYCFNDLKEHLLKIYGQINNSASLGALNKHINHAE